MLLCWLSWLAVQPPAALPSRSLGTDVWVTLLAQPLKQHGQRLPVTQQCKRKPSESRSSATPETA